MKVIGVTGGSGGGKTTVTKILEQNGAHVVDADVVAREVVKPGSPAFLEIASEWDVVSNGVLDRKALAKIVFSDDAELHKLNQIVHKYVIEDIKSQLEKCEKEVFVIDAIALFESGLCDICNVTIAIIAEKNLRCKRIMERDNLTYDEAMMRINAQKSDEFYINNADFVIYNNGDESVAQIEEILKRELAWEN